MSEENPIKKSAEFFQSSVEDNPALKASLERANNLTEKAYFSQALEVINGLIEEVQKMKLADRFKADVKPSDSPYYGATGVVNPIFRNMNEPEHKRQQLLIDLITLRNNLATFTGKLHDVIMDIETSKLD